MLETALFSFELALPAMLGCPNSTFACDLRAQVAAATKAQEAERTMAAADEGCRPQQAAVSVADTAAAAAQLEGDDAAWWATTDAWETEVWGTMRRRSKMPERLPPTNDPRKNPKHGQKQQQQQQQQQQLNQEEEADQPPATAVHAPPAQPPPGAALASDRAATYAPRNFNLGFQELTEGARVRVWWTKAMAGHLERFQYGTVTALGPPMLPRRKRAPGWLTRSFEVTYDLVQPCGGEGGKFVHDLEEVHVEPLAVPNMEEVHVEITSRSRRDVELLAGGGGGGGSGDGGGGGGGGSSGWDGSGGSGGFCTSGGGGGGGGGRGDGDGRGRGGGGECELPTIPSKTSRNPTPSKASRNPSSREGAASVCGEAAAPAVAEGAPVLDLGTRVLARFLASTPKGVRRKKPGANKWWRGTIVAVGAGGVTYDVEYDDKVIEQGVQAQFVQRLDEEEEEAEEEKAYDEKDEKEEEYVKDEEHWPAEAEPPPMGSLRLDVFRAMCAGHSTRATIFDYVAHHGESNTRGKNAWSTYGEGNSVELLRADVHQTQSREQKNQPTPLWWRWHDADKYSLTTNGEIASARDRTARAGKGKSDQDGTLANQR